MALKKNKDNLVAFEINNVFFNEPLNLLSYSSIRGEINISIRLSLCIAAGMEIRFQSLRIRIQIDI